MCGRFTFTGRQWPTFVSSSVPEIEPKFNISPQDDTPVIHFDSRQPVITSMQWGLRPHWSKKSTMEPINARLETVEAKPMFRQAFDERRCLIPANGWYEWKTTPRGKVPFYHRAADESLLLMAGIYELWNGESEVLHTFTILTQEACSDVGHIHNRMPVLIDEQAANLWLAEKVVKEASTKITVHPVGREVNKTTAQGEQLIQPLRTLFD